MSGFQSFSGEYKRSTKKVLQLLVCDCEATSVPRCNDSSPQRWFLNSSVLFLELLFIGTDN